MAISDELRKLVDPNNDCCCEHCLSNKCKEWNLKDLCRELELNYSTVHKRLRKYGKTLQEATECKACQWILDNKDIR